MLSPKPGAEVPASDRVQTGIGSNAVLEKTPPSWLQCELCARPASGSRRLAPLFQREEAHEGRLSPESLVLLCPDCCALARGEIGETEWRKRTASARS